MQPPGTRPAVAPVLPAAPPAPAETVNPNQVAALERAMTVDRIYRQDGLTIAQLAERLGMPEYRLRRLINQALGYRNFNSFLNGYRIQEAKAALADSSQAAVPVLEGDTRDTLADRILAREHELLVRALGWIAAGKVEVIPGADGRRAAVRVRGETTAFGLAGLEPKR